MAAEVLPVSVGQALHWVLGTLSEHGEGPL